MSAALSTEETVAAGFALTVLSVVLLGRLATSVCAVEIVAESGGFERSFVDVVTEGADTDTAAVTGTEAAVLAIVVDELNSTARLRSCAGNDGCVCVCVCVCVVAVLCNGATVVCAARDG